MVRRLLDNCERRIQESANSRRPVDPTRRVEFEKRGVSVFSKAGFLEWGKGLSREGKGPGACQGQRSAAPRGAGPHLRRGESLQLQEASARSFARARAAGPQVGVDDICRDRSGSESRSRARKLADALIRRPRDSGFDPSEKRATRISCSTRSRDSDAAPRSRVTVKVSVGRLEREPKSRSASGD